MGVYEGRGPHEKGVEVWTADTMATDSGSPSYELVYSSGEVTLTRDGKVGRAYMMASA